MWDMFDFNGDGHVSAGEAFIGAGIAGSIGYGAGLSEAEERESYLRDEYEGELERKRRRIEELEDEIEELRGERDSFFDDEDFDDDEYYYDSCGKMHRKWHRKDDFWDDDDLDDDIDDDDFDDDEGDEGDFYF